MKSALFALIAWTASFAPLASAAAADRGIPSYQARVAQADVIDQRKHGSRYATNRRDAARHEYARQRAPRYAPPRGYAFRHWQRGQYLPVQYGARPYELDYRTYRLAPPPRGYRYVRVDDRAVLVAITSGLIANVIDDLFYR